MEARNAENPALPALAGIGSGSAFESRPRRAHEVLTRRQWLTLCEHLHNDNDERRFVVGFNGKRESPYARNRAKRFGQAVSWAWDTITGRAKSPLAFVPYSQNPRGESRWGAIDFDAHDGNRERAAEYARAAFRVVLNLAGIFVILETTGDGGGWHVWALTRDFHPVGEWAKLLCGVCGQIGVTLKASECEVYPPPSERSEYGRAVRAPGSWNPKGGFSEIVFENVGPLLAVLGNANPPGTQEPIGKVMAYDVSGNSKGEGDAGFPDKRKKFSFSPSFPSLQIAEGGSPSGEAARKADDAPLYPKWYQEWCRQFAITAQGTRNAQLGSLTGTIFHQVGHPMAERIAREHFRSKTVQTDARLHEHLEDFGNYWRGMKTKWLAALSEAERRAFETLATDNERDAFRIVKNFARLAVVESREDFPIVRNDLCARLGITGPGAGLIRKKLAEFRVIRLVQEHRPNSKAARYVWTANDAEHKKP